MAFLEILNITMAFWGFLVCLALAVSLRFRLESRKEYRAVVMMLVAAAFSLLTRGVAKLADGDPRPFLFYIAWVSTAANYFLNFYFLGAVLVWMDRVLFKDKGLKVPMATTAKIFFGLLCLLIVVSWFTGWVYSFNASHTFRRGPFYQSMLVVVFLELAITVGTLHRHKGGQDHRRRLIYLDIIAVAIGVLLYMAFPDFFWLDLALLVCVVGHAFYFQFQESKAALEQQQRLNQQQLELAKLKNLMLENQIQPHFLHNTLNTIYYLCESDPQKARQVVHDFSFYLRTNLEFLEAEEAPAFERELLHVKTYLGIEKLRYEEKLEIVYDIAVKNFRLPVLTVQPLVENAVKHGLKGKAEGGRLLIRTREVPGGFEVTVEDNGAGYDPNQLPVDGRSHTGLKNVRGRLASQCHGTLEIQSRPGEGTVACIFIPREMSI